MCRNIVIIFGMDKGRISFSAGQISEKWERNEYLHIQMIMDLIDNFTVVFPICLDHPCKIS